MLLSQMPPNMPVELMGPLGAGTKADIEALQTALRNLSIATARPDINPGPTNTGIVDAGTVSAVVAGMGLLTEKLDSWQYLAIQAGLIAGTATNKAKEVIATYAPQLTIAANTAAVKFKTTPVPVVVGPMSFFAPGWYKTPLGLGLIAVVGLVIYKFVIAPTPAKAA
jgi:hypothetical protein